MAFEDHYQVLYSNGAPAEPIRLGQLLVDESTSPPKLMKCTSLSPLVYTEVGAGGGGTVTQVDTGTGLTGGPITTTGTVALDAASIASLALADTAVQPARTISTTAPLTGGGDLSADLTLAVNTFGAAQDGVVPLSGGGTSNFLRADGAWAVPPGGGGGGTATGLATAILADSPIGYWKCDEASGNLADSSGNGYTLIASTSPAVVYQYYPLIPGEPTTNYTRFPGGASALITSYLGLTTPLTGAWTIEALVHLPNAGNQCSVFSYGGAGETQALNTQALLYSPSSNRWRAEWESGNGTNRQYEGHATLVAIPFHLVLVKGVGGVLQFYQNGKLVLSPGWGTNADGGTGVMVAGIGQNPSVVNNSTTMDVGHVAFYDYALSSSRILAHAQAAGYAL